MGARVLVAEDDIKQLELIRRYLRHDGHDVLAVSDGQAAIDETRRWRPDLLILDVMLPGPDRLAVCRVLRQDYDLPVLMLTARSGEDDMLLGLNLGADDYMTKPYSPRELMARVRALLRRAQRPLAGDRAWRVGALTVDSLRHEVTVEGVHADCTPAEFAILAAMAAQPDRVFTRQQLLERTRGIDHYITERTVDVHVMNLRKKFEPDPRQPVYLLTVFGVGYKLTDGTPRRAGDHSGA
ncbi:MAG TPA: response regulator transcription factor [Streptosporangiaceae bacterium]|nr:response regulator transcription factor [Streptosporangiaceae bacterium]